MTEQAKVPRGSHLVLKANRGPSENPFGQVHIMHETLSGGKGNPKRPVRFWFREASGSLHTWSHKCPLPSRGEAGH